MECKQGHVLQMLNARTHVQNIQFLVIIDQPELFPAGDTENVGTVEKM
jgi:hypothetical protein